MNLWIRLFGTSEIALRFPSTIAALAAILLTALLATKISGFIAGSLAAITLTGMNVVIDAGWEARSYAPTTALVVGAALVARTLRQGDAQSGRAMRYAIAWGALAALAIGFHLFAALALLPQIAWLVPLRRRPRVLATISALLPPALVVVVMAVISLRATVFQSWIGRPNLAELRADLPVVYSWAAVVLLALGITAIVLLRVLSATPALPSRYDIAVLVGWAALPTVALLAYSFVSHPIFLPRYCDPAEPAVAVLAGVAAQGALSRGMRQLTAAARAAVAIGAVGVVLAIVLTANAVRNEPHAKTEDLRAAATFIRTDARHGDALFYAPTWAELGLPWYLDRGDGGHTPRDVLAPAGTDPVRSGMLWPPTVSLMSAERLLESRKRIWVAGYSGGASWQPLPDVGTQLVRILQHGWRKVSVHRFGSFQLALWTRPKVSSR